VLSTVVDILAILIAVRERRRGSSWWMLPRIFGLLLVANSILGLVWAP
jgi:hypothetical protein